MTHAAYLSPLQLMETHTNTLFDLNAQGRLRCINEIGEPPAPLFYMGRTLQGNRWHFRDDLPAGAVAELERLCRAEPLATDLANKPRYYAAIWEVLAACVTGKTLEEYCGPAYWIPNGLAPPARIDIALISPTNVDLCRTTFPWLLPWISHADLGPVAAAITHGQAVALCFCSRRPKVATEAGVETLADYRGRGYATAAVTAWSAAVSKLGILPMYSTTWDNAASQAIARKLQMVMYGADWSIGAQG